MTIGGRRDSEVVIISGLSGGETLVLNAPAGLEDGARVVSQAAKPPFPFVEQVDRNLHRMEQQNEILVDVRGVDKVFSVVPSRCTCWAAWTCKFPGANSWP